MTAVLLEWTLAAIRLFRCDLEARSPLPATIRKTARYCRPLPGKTGSLWSGRAASAIAAPFFENHNNSIAQPKECGKSMIATARWDDEQLRLIR
jgi:hypothetical protein